LRPLRQCADPVGFKVRDGLAQELPDAFQAYLSRGSYSRRAKAGVERQIVRLNYKRTTLFGAALLLVGLGLAGLLISLTPFEGRRGIIRLMVSILGPSGAQVFVASMAILLAIGGLRLVGLAFDGALAVEIGARGIRVRSIYYTGLLPWAAVRAVESRVVAGRGKHPMLVIHRKDAAGLLLRLVGLGDKVVVQRRFLDVDDDAFGAWIRAAKKGGTPMPASTKAHPIAAPERVFGRRQ
jgi:hypothetical protein